MTSQESRRTCPVHGSQNSEHHFSRRAALKMGALGLSATTMSTLETLAWVPQRLAHAAPSTLPDIQFDISNFIAPAQSINGIVFRFGPVYTLFVTAELTRTPTNQDQQKLADPLNAIDTATH